jgi:hypothetical protein
MKIKTRMMKIIIIAIIIFFPWHKSPQWARSSSLSRLHDHPQTHHTR